MFTRSFGLRECHVDLITLNTPRFRGGKRLSGLLRAPPLVSKAEERRPEGECRVRYSNAHLRAVRMVAVN